MRFVPWGKVGLLVLAIVGGACTREMATTEESVGGPMTVAIEVPIETDMTEEGCILHPEICHPDDDPPVQHPQVGKVYEIAMDYSIRSAPGVIDPHPTAPGVYLAVSDSSCYTRVQSPRQPDVDRDGLTDFCEYTLARAFAPMLNNGSGEECFGGEPYWAAKYFDNVPLLRTGDFVRIAYMPSYYEDCGDLFGHLGDSEFIQLTVGYNEDSQHWELFNGFLSAHTCVDNAECSVEMFGAAQEFPDASEFQFPGSRSLTYPRVYISINKHANYKSESACDNGGFAWGILETCNYQDRGRFMVWESHNIGNARYQLVNCVASQRVGADPDVEECFWTGGNFGGWHANNTGPAGYINFLHSFAYGCKWLGPGTSWCSRYGI